MRPYFQAHKIRVLTEAPLKKVLQCSDTFEWLVNWSIELNEFDIDYLPRIAIKGQTLTDFVVELTNPTKDVFAPPAGNHWQVYVNGSSCRLGENVGVYLISSSGDESYYLIRLEFKTTNNEAEYETLLVGLAIVKALGAI